MHWMTADRFRRTCISNEESFIECDDVVNCNIKVETALYEEMLKAGIIAFNIGDSERPSILSHAVRTAGEFILNLDDDFIFNPNGCIIKDAPLELKDILMK